MVISSLRRHSSNLFSVCVVLLIFLLQDLKDPRRTDEMAAARATLKKSTRMLLTSSKVLLFF